MSNIQTLNETKDKIIKIIEERGPCLPVQIASSIQTSPMFASAFLSELYAEGRIKISNMKVGSSPLYYLPNQQVMLENFVQHLNHKEKEAFHLLKKERLLDDPSQEPAIRVALRALKDFAVPIKIRIGNDSKLFWKHFLIQDNEIKDILSGTTEQKPLEPKTQQIPPAQEKTNDIPETQELTIPEKKETPTQEKQIKKKKAKPDMKFSKNLKEYLLAKEIEVLSTITEKSKEFTAKVRIDTPLGKQEFYLFGKDKKKITNDDITAAIHKAQAEKMPALIISPGEIDKKAIEHAKEWRNLIKIEKAKL